MEEKKTKKKSVLRKVLKWTGIGFLVLLVAIILIPVIFKDKIQEMVMEEVNNSINKDVAEIKLGGFDLTFLSTFPNLSVELDSLKIDGKGKFQDVQLASITQFRADVNLWDVISGDQIAIKAIHLKEPNFDVRVLPDGTANYDITIPDTTTTTDTTEEESNFKLALKKYTIQNANIKYDDQSSDMYAEINNLNHTGEGDLSADVVDFKTTTNIDKLSYNMDGVPYLTNVKTDAVVNLLMEFTDKTSKFTLKENEIKLNALTFGIDGFYEMLENKDNMDLKLDASKATFKDFLSLIPAFYQTGYESMVTKGSLALGGQVQGVMDSLNLPGWDFHLNVDNASVKYPDLPGSINNIAIKAGSTFAGGSNMDKMTVDVDKFHADFVGNTLDATLKVRTPTTDPLLISKIKANVDLATLKKVIPQEEGESYNGKLKADVDLNGHVSAIENENYEAFNAKGSITLNDMLYKSNDLNEDVAINEMVFLFSPQNLNLAKLDAKSGKSDFQINGTIDNYLGYIFSKKDDDLLKGNFAFNSNNLDLDELMNLVPASEETATTSAETSTSSTTEATEPTLVPANIDFLLNTHIKNVVYNGMNIKNVAGVVRLKDEVASLENLTMNAMGGTIGLKGSYNTQNHDKPKMDFAYSLKEIDINQLATNFLTVGKLAPIAKYATGKISSDFTMKSDLTANLDPILTSLTGLGDFSTTTISIAGFKPLDKIGDALSLTNKFSAAQTLKDISASFQFTDGKLTVKPFNVKLANIATNISGYTGFDQSIGYDVKMSVPKELVPATALKAAEQAAAKVNGLAPQLNIQTIPDLIPVNLKVGGTVLDPKITGSMKESILAATGNLKSNAKQAVTDLTNKAKDSVKSVVTNKVNEVKEDLNAKKQAILDDAQKQADKVKAEAKKSADAVRSEADKQAAQLLTEAGSNPIKKKAAQVAGDKLKKEAETKAAKIEQEGNNKADAIMAAARQKADQVK